MSRIITLLKSLDRLTEKAEALILAGAILIMAVNTIANVFGRYVFSQSLYFTEELNEFLIVAITFVGLGYITRKGRHIRMSAIYDVMPPLARKATMIVIALCSAIIMFLLAWYAYGYIDRLAARGRVTPALQIPLYLTYIWVVAGLVLAGLQYVLTIIKNLSHNSQVYLSLTVIDEYQDPELEQLQQQLKSPTRPGHFEKELQS
ncbi:MULTISPECIES: TRAP transporter small permease [Oceanimonas]|uniref:TRAP transporter small permease protein n=1 Tax=Oceanimonas doudoroffii TaxID=84158 RepID=A0A233RDK7_9GAMM|nr:MULTISPECIES: TRAP transporter small permease [Oceanimonas]NHH99298.1 Ectoine TRAP transporter small permease protein TeaB [Oceanimonas sp. MB9]OXY81452.1 C4-dicarboxylate ABC transporter substrate-binding protein [Oceanimonas doudoroffii]